MGAGWRLPNSRRIRDLQASLRPAGGKGCFFFGGYLFRCFGLFGEDVSPAGSVLAAGSPTATRQGSFPAGDAVTGKGVGRI